MPGPISREAASRKRLLEAIFSGHGGDVGSLPDFYKPQAAPQPAAPQAKPQAQKRQPGQKSAYIQQLEAEMKANQAAEIARTADPLEQELSDLLRKRTVMAPKGTFAMPGPGMLAPGALGDYSKNLYSLAGPDEQAMGLDIRDLTPDEQRVFQEAMRRRIFSSLSESEEAALAEKFQPKP